MIAVAAVLAVLATTPDTSARRLVPPRRQPAQSAPRDHWFGPDKVKHFFMSAMIQSSAYALARSADASRSNAQVAASVISTAVGVAKEVRDRRHATSFSVRDLVWDGAGALTAAALLNGTRP
jgi:uncharacterized protein YfiM (DUF2279 family)